MASNVGEYQFNSDPHVVTDTGDVDYANALADSLADSLHNIVLVGQAGAGKSTLVNTLLLSPECQVGDSVRGVTRDVDQKRIRVDLGARRRPAQIMIYDTVGFDGNRRKDALAKEKLTELANRIDRGGEKVDLLAVCIPRDNNSGRYSGLLPSAILDAVVEVFGKDIVRDRGVIVVTKCNKWCDDQQAERARTNRGQDEPGFAVELEEWKSMHREEREDCADQDVPILIAGRVLFSDSTKKPELVTDVDGSKKWLNTLWDEICCKTNPGLAGALLLRLRESYRDENTAIAVKRSFPLPSSATLVKIGLVALSAAALAERLRKFQFL